MHVDRDVLLVSGLAREAKIARGTGVVAVCGSAARLTELFDTQDRASLKAVISFGIAGGLDPDLQPGDVLVAARIAHGAQGWVSDAGLASGIARQLSSGGIEARRGSIAGVDAPIMTAADKAALRVATGADAIDMESHLAAAYAAKHGLPFGALRIISDPANRALPPAAAHALKSDGNVDIAAVLASLLRQPAQLAGLIQAGRDSAAAFGVLSRCRRLLDFGAGLGVAHL